jgi:hypothetical protein
MVHVALVPDEFVFFHLQDVIEGKGKEAWLEAYKWYL